MFFPGSKLEDGESAAVALEREILEELGIEVTVKEPLTPVDHDYPTFRITLIPFICSLRAEHPEAKEHHEIRWYPCTQSGFDS